MIKAGIVDLFFVLLRAGTETEQPTELSLPADPRFGSNISIGIWPDLYRLASIHGVSAIVWDGLQRSMKIGAILRDQGPLRELKLRWAIQVDQIESVQQQRFRRAVDFVSILQLHGIRTVVLKGIAYTSYYPDPLHREFGDLDCYLLGDYEAGNRIALEAGATVDENDYKHAHIEYKGLTIENHQFLTGFNGTEHGKRTEYLLREVLTGGNCYTPIRNTPLLTPNAMFSALFLLKHAQRHFEYEGIVVRHLLDWKLFLERNQNDLDWSLLNRMIDQMHMRPFANLITGWCVRRLGLCIDNPQIQYTLDCCLLDAFEQDLFAPHPMINNRCWWRKIPRILLRFRRMWRFKSLLDESYSAKIWNTFAYSSYLHRRPKFDRDDVKC